MDCGGFVLTQRVQAWRLMLAGRRGFQSRQEGIN